MTIKHLLLAHGTLDQYEILQRADVLLRERCGRYYGGPLTDAEAETLTPKKADNGSKAKTRTDHASDPAGTARAGH